MSSKYDRDLWKVVVAGKPPETPEFSNKQRLEIAQRRDFVHRYRTGGGPPLDPVLRSHLGLDDVERKA